MKKMNLKQALEKITTNEEMDTRIMKNLLNARKDAIKKQKREELILCLLHLSFAFLLYLAQ